MAKVKLTPGVELDLVSPQELHDTLLEILSGFRRGPQTVRERSGIPLDGNGDGTVDVFPVPLGYEFSLHRISLEFEGFTPGDPFTSSSGYALLLRNDRLVDFIDFAAGVPQVGTWGTADGPIWSNGETVALQIFAGDPDGNALVGIQGTLEAKVIE